VIFIDASLPKTVADELKKVREDVIFKHDIFRPGTDDSIWLRKVGVEGWLGITHDQRIRTRPGERDAIMSHSVGCFILTYKQDLQKPQIVRMVFDYLPEMERLFNSTHDRLSTRSPRTVISRNMPSEGLKLLSCLRITSAKPHSRGRMPVWRRASTRLMRLLW
jgi:hypothetical protein